MHANKREEKDSAGAGMIIAVMGLKNTTTGDTLCDPDKPVILEVNGFPSTSYLGCYRTKDKG